MEAKEGSSEREQSPELNEEDNNTSSSCVPEILDVEKCPAENDSREFDSQNVGENEEEPPKECDSASAKSSSPVPNSA